MIHLAQNEVRSNFITIKASYCTCQSVLKLLGTRFSNYGVYGWNCDIYFFENIALITGYRPFGKNYLTKESENQINELYNSIVKKYNDSEITFSQCREMFKMLYIIF